MSRKFHRSTKAFYSAVTENASSPFMMNEKCSARLLKIRNADYLIDASLRLRNLQVIKKLLTDDCFVKSRWIIGRVMRVALREHHLELFGLCVKHENFDPADATFAQNYPLRFAVSYNLVDLFDILMEHPGVNPFDIRSQALLVSKEHDDPYIRERLLKDPRLHTKNRDNSSFLLACKYGEAKIVASLLNDGGIDPGYASNRGLLFAAIGGHVEVLKLLLARKDVDPAARKNIVVKKAALHGQVESIKLILEDRRADPHNCLSYASRYDNLDAMKVLLGDSRVRNQTDLNNAFLTSIFKGHLRIVDYLLNKTSIDFNHAHFSPIVTACKFGNLNILKRLLEDRRYQIGGSSYHDLQKGLDNGLLMALKKNRGDIVQFLLNETTAMPDGPEFNAAQVACSLGHIELFEKLMDDPRIIITEKAIFEAAKKGHLNIVKLLLQNAEDEFVPILLEQAMDGASNSDQKDVIAYLSDLKSTEE